MAALTNSGIVGAGLPLVAFLFVVVFLRAQGTYWLARSVPAALSKWGRKHPRLAGMARWVDGPIPRKGAAILDKWGLIALPLSFLTVGLQTAVLAGAGLVRMRWGRFTVAIIPGCVVWALLYGLGLLAVWSAVVTAAAGSVWGWAALIALIGSIVVLKLRSRIRVAALANAGFEA